MGSRFCGVRCGLMWNSNETAPSDSAAVVRKPLLRLTLTFSAGANGRYGLKMTVL